MESDQNEKDAFLTEQGNKFHKRRKKYAAPFGKAVIETENGGIKRIKRSVQPFGKECLFHDVTY